MCFYIKNQHFRQIFSTIKIKLAHNIEIGQKILKNQSLILYQQEKLSKDFHHFTKGEYHAKSNSCSHVEECGDHEHSVVSAVNSNEGSEKIVSVQCWRQQLHTLTVIIRIK